MKSAQAQKLIKTTLCESTTYRAEKSRAKFNKKAVAHKNVYSLDL